MIKTDFYPVGAVLMFGGDLPENGDWLLCDGRQFKTSDYPELFKAIGNLYGGNPDDHVFRIPDYLGQLLRGAAHESSADPDRSRRQSLHPSGSAPPEGVGTVQDFATKRPNGTGFSASFNHLPTGSKKTHGVTKKDNTGYDGSSTKSQDTCTSGGDRESRPINVYLNLYIKSRS